MTEPEIDRHLRSDEIEQMIQLVSTDWEVTSASFIEDGVSAIYEVVLSTPSGRQECYLKATQALDHPMGVGTEARVTEIVRQHTDAPVPAVLGVVDNHHHLRTPFFLAESMPGEEPRLRDWTMLPAAALWSLAHQTGRYVAQMHEIPLPNVDTYGRVFSHRRDSLEGDPPSGDPSELGLSDGYNDWTTWAREYFQMGLENLNETDRFASLAPRIEAEIERLIPQLPAPERPILARHDQGLWNVLTDEKCREVTAMVDFGLQPIEPPAADLSALEWFTARRNWTGLPEVPDHTYAVRDGLEAGYCAVRSLPDALDQKRRLYQLGLTVFSMVTLETDQFQSRSPPTERADEAADGLREIAHQLLGEDREIS